MNQCSTITIILLLTGMGLLTVKSVLAVEINLASQPAKCVSLKQGNICYQEVHMQWSSSETADYCLYNQAQEKPLKCWQQMDSGEYEFDFAFPQTQQYVLRYKGRAKDLANAVIEVKWVYKARRNRFSWRVF